MNNDHAARNRGADVIIIRRPDHIVVDNHIIKLHVPNSDTEGVWCIVVVASRHHEAEAKGTIHTERGPSTFELHAIVCKNQPLIPNTEKGESSCLKDKLCIAVRYVLARQIFQVEPEGDIARKLWLWRIGTCGTLKETTARNKGTHRIVAAVRSRIAELRKHVVKKIVCQGFANKKAA